jgi:dipeptidyl aminopeptidase/acylaminoacyl peptidase
MTMKKPVLISMVLFFALAVFGGAEDHFQLIDVFQLEYAADPQISPDGTTIVYARNFMDIMKDRGRSNLWILNADGTNHRPLTSGNQNDSSPRWSPDGNRLAYISSSDDSTQIYCRWMDTGQTAKLTQLTSPPRGLSWSPDGRYLAFSMHVPKKREAMVQLPGKPEGAEWAEPAKVIRKLQYRADGSGYLKDGYYHLFVLPADGGTPRQVTTGDYNHTSPPAWTPDSKSLIFSANRHADWEYEPSNTEIHEVSLDTGDIKVLTDRKGPDVNPVVSPDGKQIAYLGYDDRYQGYQVTQLYIMNRDGGGGKLVSKDLDRSVANPRWSQDGSGLFFEYDDEGNTKLAFISLDGKVDVLTENVGGLSIGRPYAGGQFSVADTGRFAFTESRPDHPADLAVGEKGAPAKRLTYLNQDLLGHKELGQVEEIWYQSSFDGRKIQGWICKPPGFDPGKKYPLILEIHGGPFANYGDRFSAEIQLYAAAGYVVLYTNPRGSTSYGEEFGNLIHHAYPSQDYDDLMSGVDAVIAKGYVDEDNLFVTGGSGGGVLTAWIVGKTDRFRAAVSAKPVINWYSFVLTSDNIPFFWKYWFPGYPWDNLEHYMNRSPIHLAGNVTTPTMLLTGESDYRTPISESEQFYSALRLRKVDTALVRIPGASHGIANRPSQLMTKVAHILKWFEMHRDKKPDTDN